MLLDIFNCFLRKNFLKFCNFCGVGGRFWNEWCDPRRGNIGRIYSSEEICRSLGDLLFLEKVWTLAPQREAYEWLCWIKTTCTRER